MLKIRETQCRLGKFSNNLDKHGDHDLTSFDVPVTLELKAGELNALVEDKLFHRRLFDEATKGKPVTPGDGFQKFGPLDFNEVFEEARVELTLSGKIELEFEKSRISKITLTPCVGGITECSFSMHLKPRNDKEILQLLHHQKRMVQISIAGGKASAGKRQQDLALDAPKDGAAREVPSDSDEGGSSPLPPDEDEPNNVTPIR